MFQAIFYPRILNKNCFEQLLSVHFLFSEILNLKKMKKKKINRLLKKETPRSPKTELRV